MKQMGTRVCKRFISMPDSDKPERLEIVMTANNKFFNHYGMHAGHWASHAGPFDSQWSAEQAMKKHRPDVVERWWNDEDELQAVREYLSTVNLNDYDLGDIKIGEWDVEMMARDFSTCMVVTIQQTVDGYLRFLCTKSDVETGIPTSLKVVGQ